MTAQVDIAVIGAGAAGIAAARTAREAGRSVVLLEAGNRAGGRGWTERADGMALDLGCGWLHSADRNPLVKIAKESGFTVDCTRSAWRRQYRELGFSKTEQSDAQAAWSRFQHRLETDPPRSDCASDALIPGERWNAYAQALSGYMNGADLDQLSIADYLAYDEAASETNWRVREGYGALLAAQVSGLDLRLATPVTAIDHRGANVRIETRAGSLTAERAIITVSTAVLASGAIRFTPALDDHLDAAANLPLGLADKLFLALGEGHGLDPDTHLLGNPHDARTGSYYIRPFGQPVVEAFFGGSGAQVLEREGLAAAFAFAIEELCALLGSDFRAKLRPLIGSSWCRMDYFRGSYSHALPGHAAARGVLASPAGRLFFAGEATHATDFSTAHGAWESGIRAAGEALAELR